MIAWKQILIYAKEKTLKELETRYVGRVSDLMRHTRSAEEILELKSGYIDDVASIHNIYSASEQLDEKETT